MTHADDCLTCEHDCPWRGTPLGAPFCAVCDDHMERSDDDSEDSEPPTVLAWARLAGQYGRMIVYGARCVDCHDVEQDEPAMREFAAGTRCSRCHKLIEESDNA